MNVSQASPYLSSPALKIGDKISVQVGDRKVTHVITAFTRHTGTYTPAPPLTRWQRIIRAITPPRWRKPLPQGSHTLDTIEIASIPEWAATAQQLLDTILYTPTVGSPPPVPPTEGGGESPNPTQG